MHLKDPVSSSHSVSSVDHSESVPLSEKNRFLSRFRVRRTNSSIGVDGRVHHPDTDSSSVDSSDFGRSRRRWMRPNRNREDRRIRSSPSSSLGLERESIARKRTKNPRVGFGSTRELASQIRDSFYTYGQYTSLRTSAIYGGVSQMPQEKALRNGIDILVATPGRLMDLMQQGFVDLSHVECLVLDEADRMLDMGFLPAIRQIVPHLPKNRQTLLFSATMPDAIIELASDVVSNPVNVKIEPVRKTTELVDQHLCLVPQKMKTSFLIEMIQELKPGRAIVFSKTKHGADRIAKHLFAANIKAEAIHSNKSQTNANGSSTISNGTIRLSSSQPTLQLEVSTSMV